MIGDNTDRTAAQPGKSDNYIHRKIFMHLKKLAIIDNAVNHFFHVVRFIRILRDNAVEFFFLAIQRIGALGHRRVFQIIQRDIAEQLAYFLNSIGLVFAGKMSHS